MVVKMENAKPKNPTTNTSHSQIGSQPHVGNHLKLKLKHNTSDVVHVGNHNKISIEVNDGTVKIIGNGCRVKMDSGRGSVLYIGNDGLVTMGESVTRDQIACVGNRIKVLHSNEDISASYETFETKKTSKCSHRVHVNCANMRL